MNILETDPHRGWGGQAAYLLLLSRTLAARGHGVTVACPRNSELAAKALEAGLEVFDVVDFARGFRPVRFYRDVRAIGMALRDLEVDVVHCHGSQDSWISAVARKWYCPRTAVVRTKHNFMPVKTHSFNRWLYGTQFDHCTAVAGPVAERLAPLVPSGRITTLHAPVDDRFLAASPSAVRIREQLGLDADARLVVHVARLSKLKGQDLILDAAPAIRSAVPDAHILLIGTGEEYHRLLARIEDENLSGTVRLLEFRDDVPAILHEADVAVLPSVEPEGSPIALKEAMACGLPVVATRLGGIPEIVEDGRTGLLIPPRDPETFAEAVVTLLREPDRASEMGRAGREAIRSRFTADAVGAAFESLFSRLCADKAEDSAT